MIQAIIDDVTRGLLKHEEAAIKHGVSSMLVGRLLRAYRQNPDFVAEYATKLHARSNKSSLVMTAVTDFKSAEQQIWKAEQLAGYIMDTRQVQLSNAFVASVMRNHLGMRYKKVRRIPWQGNTERAVVLRCLSSKLFLEGLDQGVRYLSVDETFIDDLQYT